MISEFFNRGIILFIKGVGSLSFHITYLLADILYFVLFRLAGYRKTVVITNLKKSFPEKSDKEIHSIAARFYRNLADLIMESLKMYSITEAELRKRMLLEDLEILDEFHARGKSIIIVCAHYGNYEYGAIRLTLSARHRINTVYKQLTSKIFDDFLQKSRSKFGTNLVPTKEIYQVLEEEKKQGILSASGLVSDQTPSAMKGYWMDFLNQDTPVFMGCENLAKLHDMPVVYGEVNQLRRGYYVLKFKTLIEEPLKMKHGEITEIFTKTIEDSIKRNPELWMWSHKRWKKKIPEGLPSSHFSKKYPVRSG